MEAVLRIFEAAQVPLGYEFVEMGKSVFDAGHRTGMTDDAKGIIERTGILFKGPMETPKGKGVKSINVTARKVWNTYANIRKFRSFAGVDTVFSKAGIPINMTVLRENIEDTYGGIEYMHNYDVAVSYRLVTRPGTEQFMRFAFDYANREGIKQITCGHKANIMKLTDGIFMDTFYTVAKEYPEIEVNDLIVDDLAMKLVRFPEKFKLILLSNLQGDILSDLCAGLVGGLGFAPSANVGDNISIFEAVHGTAPDIAGKKLANPTSLLLSGLIMLRHLGCISQADAIENALLYILEQGMHTGDFGAAGTRSLSTDEFADAIIANLGKAPGGENEVKTPAANFTFQKPAAPAKMRMMYTQDKAEEQLLGMDIFIESPEQPADLAKEVENMLPGKLILRMISNRGTQVYPEASKFTECVANQRARLEVKDGETLTYTELFEICAHLGEKFKIADVVVLKKWGELKGYSLAQGQ